MTQLRELGRKFDAANAGRFDQKSLQGKADDVSVMLYIRAPPVNPRRFCQSHRAFITDQGGASSTLSADDNVLSYLPMAWVGDHLFYAQALVASSLVNCPESADTVMTDLREIGPTYYFAPPRVFESVLTSLSIAWRTLSR